MIMHAAIVVTEAACSVRAPAAEIVRVEVLAIGWPALLAKAAAAAGHESQHDMIARPHLDDIGADFFDDACAFVAEYDRLRHRVDLIAHNHVGMAHAGGNDTHQNFIGARLLQLQFLERKGSALLAHYRGSHRVRGG